MSTNPCPITERLATADSGALDRSLHAHVGGCPSCQDMLLVTAALAAAADDDEPLPDPRVLWLRARREARARAARRASRAIDVVQMAAATLIAGALVAVAVAVGPSFGGALAEAFLGLVTAPGLFGLPIVAMAAVVALLVPPLVALADRL
jgi:hypothetical protein